MHRHGTWTRRTVLLSRAKMCALQTTLYAYNSRDYFAKRNVEQIFLQLYAAFQFNVESYRLMVSVGF